jgi:hypothetical protein
MKLMASNKIGRPTVFTPDCKDLILEYIEAGYSNEDACSMVGLPHQNFYLTISRDQSFRERYEAAKAVAVEAVVDAADREASKVLTAENGTQVAAAKVFIDHKWKMASRLAPQRWGEKASVHVTGQISDDPQELAKRLAFLQALQGGEDEEGPEVAPEA